MIVVDASALIAILDEERDAARYAEAIAEADPPLVSAATVAEAESSCSSVTAPADRAN